MVMETVKAKEMAMLMAVLHQSVLNHKEVTE
jgi:hypothetical protein